MNVEVNVSCIECDDSGFTFVVDDYKTKEKIYSNVEQVKRCSRFVLYFSELKEHLGIQAASLKIKLQRIGETRPFHGCGAAVAMHESIRASEHEDKTRR